MCEIIVINGTGTSGKDTVINFIKKYRRVFNYSTIDYIKFIMKEHFGWDGESKTEADRLFMARLKQIWKEYNNGPFNYTKQYLNNINLDKFDFVFIHCRESDEIADLTNYFKKSRSLLVHKNLDINFNNKADQDVYNYDNYDYIINNTGDLKYLEELSIKFINEVEQEDV